MTKNAPFRPVRKDRAKTKYANFEPRLLFRAISENNIQTIYSIQTKIEKYHYLFIVLEESSHYPPTLHPLKIRRKIQQ
jgi:hypothetical protein